MSETKIRQIGEKFYDKELGHLVEVVAATDYSYLPFVCSACVSTEVFL